MTNGINPAEFADVLDTILPAPQVSIIEWAEGKDYLHYILLPAQRIILKIYAGEQLLDWERGIVQEWVEKHYVPPDIWDKINTGSSVGDISWVKELVLVVGRRGAKTFLVGIIISYEVYRLLSKPDPQRYYGLPPHAGIRVACCASTNQQAKDTVYDSVRGCILNNPWFEDYLKSANAIGKSKISFSTLADQEKMKSLAAKGVKNTLESVSIELFSASSFASGRGRALIVIVFDELAWFQTPEGKDNAKELYEAMTPSAKTFGKDARVISLSSPKYPNGKFWELWDRAFSPTTDDPLLGFHFPTWVMYEHAEKVFGDYIPEFTLSEEDLKRTKDVLYGTPEWRREYGAEFQKSIDRFLPPWAIERMFAKSKELNWDFQEKGTSRFFYHGHGDPAKNGASFAILVAHREADIVFVDDLWVFRVAKGYNDWQGERERMFPVDTEAIVYSEVEDKLETWIQNYDLRKFTFDQWNSIGSIQRLQAFCHTCGKGHTRFAEETFTGSHNYNVYKKLKNALLSERVVCAPHVTLSAELYGLMDNNGKVEKQKSGPCTTKDICDALAVTVTRLLEDEEAVQPGHNRTTGMRGGPHKFPSGSIAGNNF